MAANPVENPGTAGERVVRGACPHDCPDTCALRVTVRDGTAVRVAGDPDHPPTAGALCTKVSRYLERVYAPDRLSRPLRRVGPKGSGRFEPASWDEALDAIAARLSAIAARDPQRILPYSYAGTMGIVQGDGMGQRFFHALGASRLDRTICSSPGIHGLTYTLGGPVGMDVERFADARLILIWGSNPITSSVHFWALAQQAKRRGARLVAIDPYRTATAEKCDMHVALRPGTDGALALGLVRELVRQGLVDRDWVDAHTVGFDALVERAQAWTPERVAETCGIPAAQVVELARDYGTLAPAAIRLNYGMQRTRGGANAVRLVAGLPALVGAWKHPAGGVLLSASGHFNLDVAAWQRPDLLAGRNPRTVNMSTIGDALLEADPPIEAIVVWNSNPVAVAPDSTKVRRGFGREDLFTVVIEQFMTDTADHADWVLPATSQLEHFDLHKTYGHRWWLVNRPAIAPLGEALPNSEVFRRLAARMGLDHPALRATDEELAADALDVDDPRLPARLAAAAAAHPHDRVAARRAALAALSEIGYAKLAVPEAAFADGGFPTPSGKVEFVSARLAAQGLDPLGDHLPPRESPESDPALAARYPLQMISPPARHFMNSTFVNVESLRRTEGEPAVDLNPADAAARGLADGARVRVFNDRGAFLARLRVSERARPGVAVGWGVWWPKLAPGGHNVNAVTGQALTDLGRGPTFYDCLVEVEADARDATGAAADV
ncbi:MAG: molybdopterin oxidoreductase family protein [Burkholderiales bacterium]